MLRLAGQFLAVIAVLASAVNAQCALSCSLQGMAGNAGHEAQIIHSHRGSHACCPDESAPAQPGKERPQEQPPCPIPVVTPNIPAVVKLIQHSPQFYDGLTTLLPSGSLPIRQYLSSVFTGSSGVPDIPAFSILRI